MGGAPGQGTAVPQAALTTRCHQDPSLPQTNNQKCLQMWPNAPLAGTTAPGWDILVPLTGGDPIPCHGRRPAGGQCPSWPHFLWSPWQVIPSRPHKRGQCSRQAREIGQVPYDRVSALRVLPFYG